MINFTVLEVLKATKGTLLKGEGRKRIRGISTNSKAIKKGNLFVALVGKKHDAHDFLLKAVEEGATSLLVSREPKQRLPQSINVIKVKDTTLALGDLARAYRDRFSLPVIAITGSAGKTTTKEMIAAVLGKKYKVLKNEGTENNQFGVPLTLFKLSPKHDVAVIEVGTNCPGDIAWLASIVKPTVAVLTNIGESHLELLKTPHGVFKEKFELARALSKKGTVVANNDDKFLRKISSLTRHKVVTYGVEKPAQVFAKDVEVQNGCSEFRLNGKTKFRVRGTSTANISNALAAVCCGRLFRISYNEMQKVLAGFSLKSSRHLTLKLGGITLIDDTYNANPVSFRNALQSLRSYQPKGRRILICGDMLELGESAPSLHEDMGTYAVKSGVSVIFSIGNFSRLIGQKAKTENSSVTALHASSPQELKSFLIREIQQGDVVLIKGSRGMHMEQFIDAVKGKRN